MPEEQERHYHTPDGDSNSNYMNNTSEEEDYDKGLPEEESITYYVHYCPEDDSYLEGMDYNWEEYLAHGVHPVDTDECQEARTDSAGLHPYGHGAERSQDYRGSHLPILEDKPSVLEAHDQEEDGHYCHSKEGYQDCYPMEANGNTSASLHHLRCGDGDLEDQEEDINQIMSLSMTSITSAKACLSSKASCSPGRHETRPKSLNFAPEAKHHGDPQKGFKPKIRTPEERLKWPHKQF
ncbi:Amyloid-beta A4 precursor protein-binding family A member 2 [Plecturocebus cupreus]